MIPALWGQSQEDFCEFEDSKVYRTNSRTCTRDTLSQKTEQKKKKKNQARDEVKWQSVWIAATLHSNRTTETSKEKKNTGVKELLQC